MNKLVLTLVLSLLISFVLVWYLATRAPHSGHTKAQDSSLIVGTNAEYSPFSFMENGEITGFDIDLINEVAKRLDKTIQLKDMPFDALIPALQSGSIHVIAAGITPTTERAKQVIFTKPYLSGDQLMIVTRASNPVKTLDQLCHKKTLSVAVNEGFTADYYTSDYYSSRAHCPNLIRFATPIESFMALNSGRSDALVAAQSNIKPFIEHFGAGKFSIAPIPNTTDEYALAISKKYPELLKPIQNALDEIMQDGTLEVLKKKWKLD